MKGVKALEIPANPRELKPKARCGLPETALLQSQCRRSGWESVPFENPRDLKFAARYERTKTALASERIRFRLYSVRQERQGPATGTNRLQAPIG